MLAGVVPATLTPCRCRALALPGGPVASSGVTPLCTPSPAKPGVGSGHRSEEGKMSQGEEGANSMATVATWPSAETPPAPSRCAGEAGGRVSPRGKGPPGCASPPWGAGRGPGRAAPARGERSSCVYFPSAGGNNRGFFLFCFALFHFIFFFLIFFFEALRVLHQPETIT